MFQQIGRLRRAVALIVTISAVSVAGLYPFGAISEVVLGRFSSGTLEGWETESFAGRTNYRFVTLEGETVLEATSEASASGLVLEREIDLRETPILVWRWRVERPVRSLIDERTKEGDDFAARIYFVVPGSGMFSFPESVVYVWSRSQPVGTSWDNPYTGKVKMIAVESGSEYAGAWRTCRTNMLEDFRRLFSRDVSKVKYVAIMTDTDNTKTAARSWYGDIRVEPAQRHARQARQKSTACAGRGKSD